MYPFSIPFQSTLPAWGATSGHNQYMHRHCHFNPRSLYGERRLLCRIRSQNHIISIHAPCMGSDNLQTALLSAQNISIHAPCMGSDRHRRKYLKSHLRFQSTLPVWGATNKLACLRLIFIISIHAPCMGSDSTVKAYSNNRIKRSTLRELHFFYSKNAFFSPFFPCVLLLRAQKLVIFCIAHILRSKVTPCGIFSVSICTS